MEKLKKSVCIQEWGKDILADVLGALLYGAGVYVFAVNANFAPGGITGLAILVNHFFPFLPIGTLTVIINIPVILLCYAYLGKKYLVNMYWDQRVYHHNFYGIALQEYSTAEEKLIGKPEIIYKGTDIAYTEGPHLYYINDMYPNRDFLISIGREFDYPRATTGRNEYAMTIGVRTEEYDLSDPVIKDENTNGRLACQTSVNESIDRKLRQTAIRYLKTSYAVEFFFCLTTMKITGKESHDLLVLMQQIAVRVRTIKFVEERR